MEGKCPLTGMPCNEHKCIHITDIKDFKAEKVLDLCHLCGNKFVDDENPVDDPMKKIPQAVADFLTILDGLLQVKLGQIKAGKLPLQGPPIPEKAPCPECGCTLEDIAQAARLGCAYCYAHFGDELIPVLHQAHGSVKHVGKVPKEWLKRKLEAEAKEKPQETVEDLEKQMKDCLKVEDYEMAAKLRDRIKEMKQSP